MERLSVKEIIMATKGRLIRGNEEDYIERISTDSRTLSPGDFFIPLKGKRFDGHSFIGEAKKRGAKGVLFSEEIKEELPIMIKVENTKTALHEIAGYYRRKFHPRVVAITGSNGKTTVKEMVAKIASLKYKVLKSPESYNNDIGVPLTLLRLTSDTEILILEMEMNQIGGTRLLCEMSLPDIGAITNISDTHLEFMKTRGGVAREKRELLESLPSSGIAVLNGDDLKVAEIGKGFTFKKLTFGLREAFHFSAHRVNQSLESSLYLLNGRYRVYLPLPGIGSIYNSLCAIAIASALMIDLATAISALANFSPPPLRYQLINLKNYKILLDCYNANPASMEEALKTITQIAPKRRIGVLGDMKELGERSREFHYELGRRAAGYLDLLIALGEFAPVLIAGAREEGMAKEKTYELNDADEVVALLLDILKPYDTILIKGSRAMNMERIYYKLKGRYDE